MAKVEACGKRRHVMAQREGVGEEATLRGCLYVELRICHVFPSSVKLFHVYIRSHVLVPASAFLFFPFFLPLTRSRYLAYTD